VKAIQLALDIPSQEKWPVLYPYTDSWVVASALWGWLQQWRKNNWHRRGKLQRIELDNGTHFHNSLIDIWAKQHGTEWVYHIPYHTPASGKIKRYNGLLKTTLRAMEGWDFQKLGYSFSKATWLVNTRGSTNWAGLVQSKLPRPVEGDKVLVVHMRNMLGKTVWVSPALGKGKPVCRIAFAQGPGCNWCMMLKDGEA